MKRNTLFILMAAAGLLAVGCTKQYVTRQVTEQTIIQGTEMIFVDFDVPAKKWTNQGECFEALLEVPEITKQVVEKGAVQVSRRLLDDNNKVYWTPLPVIHVDKTEGSNGEDFFYTTFTDYEWTEGWLSIFVTTTDLFTGENPGDRSFRVTITI